MGVLKWAGYTVAALLALSVIVGVGIFVLTAGIIIGIFSGLMGIVSLLAFVIRDYFESSMKK